jgi:hypothetical protein
VKILITGYTTRMYGSNRLRHDYITFTFLLEEILKELGHDVSRKHVEIGEQIAYVYDYAFCGVAPLSSISAAKVPETHYVMDQLPGRHAIYADDWSFCSYGKSTKYALERWGNYLEYKNFPYGSHTMEATKHSLSHIVTMTIDGNNAPVLAPMFPWGDHEFLMKDNYKARLVTVDPSPWVKYPTVEIPALKDKVWVMAALSNHSNWVKKQALTFPVRFIGNKALGDVLTENETIQLFAKSFGVLSCGYPSSGSGWWRTRFLNASWAESVLYCDPRDAAVMGTPYQISPQVMERAYYYKYDYCHMVDDQKEWLNFNLGKKEQALETIERLIAK